MRTLIILILLCGVAVAQGLEQKEPEQKPDRQSAIVNMDAAVKEMNELDAWEEYLRTGKTNIPKAVRREIGKEFIRGKGFRIIKGEKVQVRTSPRQQRAIKVQGRKR